MKRNIWTDLQTLAMICMASVGLSQTLFGNSTSGAIWTVGAIFYGLVVSKGWRR